MSDLHGSECQVEFHTNARGNESDLHASESRGSESDLHGSESQAEFHTNARGNEKEAKCEAKVKDDFFTPPATPPASPHDTSHFRRAISIHLEALQSFLITQYEKDMTALKEENARLVQRLLAFDSASSKKATSQQPAADSTGEPCSEPSPQRLEECLQTSSSSLQHCPHALDPAVVCTATLQQFAIFSPEPSESSARSEALGESLCDQRDSGGVAQDHKPLLEGDLVHDGRSNMLEDARSFPLPSADAPASSLQHLSRSLQHENVQVDEVVPLLDEPYGLSPPGTQEPGTQSQGMAMCYESENYAIVDSSAEQHKDNRKTPTSDELSAEQHEESCSSKTKENPDLGSEVLRSSAFKGPLECSQLAPSTSSQQHCTFEESATCSSAPPESSVVPVKRSQDIHLETSAEGGSYPGDGADCKPLLAAELAEEGRSKFSEGAGSSLEAPASSGHADAHADEGAGADQMAQRAAFDSSGSPAVYVIHEKSHALEGAPLLDNAGIDLEASASLSAATPITPPPEHTEITADMNRSSTEGGHRSKSVKQQLMAHNLSVGAIASNFKPPRDSMSSMQGEAPDYNRQIMRVKRFINSAIFEIIMGTVIILNIATIFVQLQWQGYQSAFVLGIDSSDRGYAEAEKVFSKLDLLFNAIYLAELVLRLWVKRLQYFCDIMGSIDAVVVVVCCLQSFILEPAELSLEPSLVRLVRLFRLFRIIKIFRFMNQVEELRILLRTLSLSASSLLWSMLLIGVIIVAAGVLMAQLTLSYIEDESADPDLRRWVYKQYGTAGKATFSMFEGAFTGVWTAKSEPLLENVSFGYGLLYIGYVVTINFAMIRVISALFLKQTMSVASSDADERAAEKMHERAKYMAEVHHFFDEQDASGDGVLDQEEFDNMLKTSEVLTLLHMLELSKDEARMLFEVLSGDEGAVDYREFLDGAMKMRHSSRAVEAVQMLHEITVIQRRLDNLSEGLEIVLDTLRPGTTSWNRLAVPRRKGPRSSVCYQVVEEGDVGGVDVPILAS